MWHVQFLVLWSQCCSEGDRFFLEGDTVVLAVNEMGASWYKKLIPFGIDRMVFERSLAKGRC